MSKRWLADCHGSQKIVEVTGVALLCDLTFSELRLPHLLVNPIYRQGRA